MIATVWRPIASDRLIGCVRCWATSFPASNMHWSTTQGAPKLLRHHQTPLEIRLGRLTECQGVRKTEELAERVLRAAETQTVRLPAE